MTEKPKPPVVFNTIQRLLKERDTNANATRFNIAKISNNLSITEACEIYGKKIWVITPLNFHTGNLMGDSHRTFEIWYTRQDKTVYFIFNVDEWVVVGNTS